MTNVNVSTDIQTEERREDSTSSTLPFTGDNTPKTPRPLVESGKGGGGPAIEAGNQEQQERVREEKRKKSSKRHVSPVDSLNNYESSPERTLSDNYSSDPEPSSEGEEDIRALLNKKGGKRKRSTSPTLSTHSKSSKKECQFDLFMATTEQEKKSWEMPSQLAEYFNKNSRKYISDKDIVESITGDYPVPSNVIDNPKMDEFMVSMIRSAGHQYLMDKDKDLQRVQGKIRDIMGPLASAWTDVELYRKGENDQAIDINEMAEKLQKAVVLVGQASNAICYQRRLSVLGKFTDVKEAKSLLRDNVENLATVSKDLFGKDFKAHLKAETKTSKSVVEFFSSKKKKPSSKQPFSANPFSFSNQRGKGDSNQMQKRKTFGGAFARNNYNKPNNSYNNKGKFSTKSFSQHAENSRLVAKPETCSSNDKMHVLRKRNRDAFSRKDKTLSAKLATNYKRPSHTKHCKRLGNPFKRRTNSIKMSTTNTYEQIRGKNNRSGNRKHVEKRSHTTGNPQKGSDSKQHLSHPEKRGGISTGNKSEGIEQIYTLPTLQDGGSERCTESAPKRGSDVQIRSQGCLLFCSPKYKIKETSKIQVEGETIRVPMSGIWPSTSSKDIYETYESANIHPSKDKHSASYLPRRHAIDGNIPVRHLNGSGLGYVPFSPSGPNSQHEEISVDPSERNRIPGHLSEQSGNDIFSSKGKNRISEGPVPKHIDFETDNPQGTFITGRKIESNSSSSHTCTTSITLFTTSSGARSTKGISLRNYDISYTGLCNGTKMVDKQHKSPEGKTSCYPSPRFGDPIGRSQNWGLGGSHSQRIYRGDVEEGRNETSHQHFRTTGSRISYQDIHERKEGFFNPPTNRQHSSFILPDKDGRNKEHRINKNLEENLALPIGQGDHSYCRVDPFSPECHGRLGVQKCGGFHRMEIIPTDFYSDLPNDGSTQCRPFCIKSVASNSNIYESEIRSTMPSHRCISPELGTVLPICLPTILSDLKSSQTSINTVVRKNDNHYPSLANSTLVPSPSINVNSTTYPTPKHTKFVNKSIGANTSTDSNHILGSSGWDGLRKTLSDEGISGQAGELIINARRKGTILNYESAWKKWDLWCSGKQIDPFKCSVNHILEFLSNLYEKGLQYRTIGVYRSAISAYHLPINGINIGKHPRTSALMTGISNLNPPQPKYGFTWDVEKVLKYLRSLPTNSALSHKQMTLKVTMLLSLVAINRGSELKTLDLNYLSKYSSKYSFSISQTVKHSRRGKVPPPVIFYRFPEDILLCPIATLDSYIDLTKTWRGKETQLFLSHVSPHKAIGKSTIARWLKEVLNLSGINTDHFQAHSVRGASSSKVSSKGLSVQDILNRGNWSNESTWQRFYHKEVETPARRFQDSLLKL